MIEKLYMIYDKDRKCFVRKFKSHNHYTLRVYTVLDQAERYIEDSNINAVVVAYKIEDPKFLEEAE